MRVLFVRQEVLSSLGIGADHHLPGTLARLGHSVTVIVRAGGCSRALASAGVGVIEVSPDESWLGRLRRAACSLQPDIVHVFLHTGCGLCPLVMRTNPKARFVLDIRSPLLRTGCIRHVIRLKNRLEVVGYDAVCTHGKESARTVIGTSRDLVWIPPGIDFTAVPARSEEQPGALATRLVYVGSLDRKRRIEAMVEAVSLAATDLAVSLDIYGYGDPERRVLQAIRARQMTRVIAVHDAVQQAELFKRLSECDIGLAYVPRVPYDSALPLKTLEYLACGLPVVATDTIGNRMVVQPGVNGLLVNEDPRAFGAGIRELATAAWWWSARQNARPSVESFDWERIVSHRLLPLYQTLLG